MHPVLFKFGPLTIYTYGVFVFIGVFTAYLLSLRQARREDFDTKIFSDMLFWSVVVGFVSARLLYIVIEWRWFLKDPFAVVFSRAGFVFFGGIIGAVIFLYAKGKKNKFNFPKVLDILSTYVPLGHAFGRLGCFFYGCCYGLPTASPIGIQFPPDSPAGLCGVPVIPTQLISAFFLVVIYCLLRIIKEFKRFDGQVFTWYLFLYGVFRFIIEFFRADPRGFWGPFSTSQWIALIFVVGGIISWIKLSRSRT